MSLLSSIEGRDSNGFGQRLLHSQVTYEGQHTFEEDLPSTTQCCVREVDDDGRGRGLQD